MDKKPAYIDESVVFPAVFRPEQAALPEVRFRYRPIPARRMTAYQKGMGSPERTFETCIRIITRQVVEWDVEKPNGEPVSHTNEREVEKLEHHIVIGVAEMILDSAAEAEEEAKN